MKNCSFIDFDFDSLKNSSFTEAFPMQIDQDRGKDENPKIPEHYNSGSKNLLKLTSMDFFIDQDEIMVRKIKDYLV